MRQGVDWCFVQILPFYREVCFDPTSYVGPNIPNLDTVDIPSFTEILQAIQVELLRTVNRLPRRVCTGTICVWDFNPQDTQADGTTPLSSVLTGLRLNLADGVNVQDIPVERTNDEQQTLALYRSIDRTELAYVRGSGYANYGVYDRSAGKYFAFTEDGARTHARHFSEADQDFYTITFALYEAEVLEFGFIFNDVDLAGIAIQFSNEVLIPEVYPRMRSAIVEIGRINPSSWR